LPSCRSGVFHPLPDVPTAEETGIPVTMTAERGFAAPKAVSDEVAKKLEAAIADGLRNPEYIKSSPGDAPVLAFMPGAEWQKRLDDMSQTLRPFAEEMRGARAEVKRATLGALSCLWWGLKVSCAARRNSGPEGDLLSKAPILR
jgi:hypothetical protein